MKLLTNEYVKILSKEYDLNPAITYAFDKIESNGCGYYLEEGKWKGELKVLFEGHYFHRLTNGKFAKQRPDLSYPKWIKGITTKFYRKGQEEFTRFMEALRLDKKAALLSTSWGRFQIMGFSAVKAGYKDVNEMVTSFYDGGEPEQMLALINYLKNTNSKLYNKNLFDLLKLFSESNNSKYIEEVVRLYNGNGQVEYYKNKFLKFYGEGLRVFQN